MKKMKKVLCAAVLLLCAATPHAWSGTLADDLALGVKQVEEGDFRSAIATLDGVTKRIGADRSKAKELSRAYVYMAIAYVGMSQEAAARDKFLEAWRNDTALKLSRKEFSPRVIETFEQAVREARKVPASPGDVAAMMTATQTGDVAGMYMILARAPGALNGKDPDSGNTALHLAALRGNKVVIAYLVGAGADLSATNTAGETPRDIVERARRQDLAAYLSPPPAGAPAAPREIFEAAKVGDIGRLRQILVQDPAAIERKDTEFGATPLHWAALKGLAATSAFLLGAGADPEARNASNETPRDVAQRAAKPDVLAVLRP
jgi:hypothetical protein